jgi:hypothetical protein
MPRFEDGSSSIVLDDSLGSILVSTSFGVTTEKLTRQTFDWLHTFSAAVRARKSHYVTVIDARGAARPPASVRGLIATLTDELRAFAPGVELGSLFVAESALIRGALTAIMWVSRSSWQPIMVSSCDEALQRGAQILRNAGVEPPKLPARYSPPPAPK